jgi:hypothetical protein
VAGLVGPAGLGLDGFGGEDVVDEAVDVVAVHPGSVAVVEGPHGFLADAGGDGVGVAAAGGAPGRPVSPGNA